MNIEQLREYCLTIKGASESFPFTKFGRGAENILVFKVMAKLFVYVDICPSDGVFRLLMKCTPERSKELRSTYEGIYESARNQDGKWNVVELDSDVPDMLIKELIDLSVKEVINGLSKKKQREYWEE